MRIIRVIAITALLLIMASAPVLEASSGGKFNTSSGCTCHGSGGSAQLSGQPASYTPGQAYTLTMGHSGTSSNAGFSLVVSKGSLSNPSTNAQVNGQGTSATHSSSGSSSWTVTWTAPSAGSGTATLSLAAMSVNANGATSGDSYGTTSVQVPELVGNTAPTVSSVTITPQTNVRTDSSLTLSYNFNDVDGDSESGTTIEWLKSGAVQSQFSGTTIPASATTKGDQWQARVTPSDGTDQGNTVLSNTVTILNSAPVVTSASISPSNPNPNNDLTLIIPSGDADNDPLVNEVKWYRDGIHISGLDDEEVTPAFATRNGEEWYAEVRVSDGSTFSQWATTSSVFVGGQNAAPSLSQLQISPAVGAMTGDELEASWSFSDSDGNSQAGYEVEWLKNGQIQSSYDEMTLPSEATERGDAWSFKVRVSDGIAWSDWQTSSAVTIVNTAPEITSVSVDMTEADTTQDITVTFEMTDADGDLESNSEITWYRDGNEISSLEDQTTLPASATKKGDVWMAKIRAGDGQALSSSMNTDSISILNSAPEVAIELAEFANSTEDLTLTFTTQDADEDDVTQMIKWYRNGFYDESLDGLPTLTSDLLGPTQVWTVEVIANDGQTDSAASSASVEIVNQAPTALITIESENLWQGSLIFLNAMDSSDPDNDQLSYMWTVVYEDGNSLISGGDDLDIYADGMVDITLEITDAHGAKGYAHKVVTATQGPVVSGLMIQQSGKSLDLSWDWNGDSTEFHIYRDGEYLKSTTDNQVTVDLFTEGDSTYQVTPTIGIYDYNGGAQTSSITIEALEPVQEAESGSAGLVIGVLFLLISIAVLSLGFINRGE